MTVEALIDASVLIEHLESKRQEIPSRLGELVQTVSNIYRNSVVLEAPRITGNLKSSIRVEDVDPLTRRVYPDEGQAPMLFMSLKVSAEKAGSSLMISWEEELKKEGKCQKVILMNS